MTLQSVKILRVQDMTPEQRKELNIEITEGLVALESHNSDYHVKPVLLKHGGIINYILNGD